MVRLGAGIRWSRRRRLIHWELGVLLGLATVVLAAPVVSRPWAWLAGAVVVLVPGVSNQMTAPMNDLALALMTTLALPHGGGRLWPKKTGAGSCWRG